MIVLLSFLCITKRNKSKMTKRKSHNHAEYGISYVRI